MTNKWRSVAAGLVSVSALLVLSGAPGLSAQAPVSGKAVAAQAGGDEEFARLVREWTTRPEFLSPLVDHLPKVPGIPSPKDVLGYHIGAAEEADLLRGHPEVLPGPRRGLAARSRDDRSARPTKAARPSSSSSGREASIANLEQHRRDLGQLADPRPLTEAQAMEIVGRAKPIYHLDRGPAQRRDRAAGDADGAGVPARRRGLAAHHADPGQRHRVDHAGGRAGRTRSLRRLVLRLQDRGDGRRAVRSAGRPTGASTSSTTTTATSISRRSRRAPSSTGTCSGTRPSCTNCTSRCRSCTPSAARRRRTRRSTRSSTANCRGSRTSRWPR